jgi:hypothetical protein
MAEPVLPLALPDIEEKPRLPDRVQFVLLAMALLEPFMAPLAALCAEVVLFMQLPLFDVLPLPLFIAPAWALRLPFIAPAPPEFMPAVPFAPALEPAPPCAKAAAGVTASTAATSRCLVFMSVSSGCCYVPKTFR